jgi:asparagine synthase (glutamine-hydrolysing)
MCGISGIVDKRDRPIGRAEIERITGLIAHRGPDDHGYFHGENFALGHRRLSIIDLSSRGHQPMAYGGRYWITYNGEIYNYLELREELASLGAEFETGSDTEVILAAYARWGVGCLERFNGMWAFAIYDSVERSLFLARDRFGVKPLYYTQSAEQFVFGSEIKQLIPAVGAQADRRVLVEALLTSIDGHTDATYFEGVRSLLPSHYLIYDLRMHRAEVKRYYTLRVDPSTATLPDADCVGRLAGLLADAVRLRLRSDVRVGTCLSGGLDSSAISALASAEYRPADGAQFIGIHAQSLDSEVDESVHAKRVAAHLGLDLKVVVPTTDDFLGTIDEVVYTQEEPFGSPSMFMGWHVFKAAKEMGCKVMLNGQGGDEVLLGYERYFAAFLRSAGFLEGAREALAQARHSRLSLAEVIAYAFYFTNPTLRASRLKRRSYLRADLKGSFDFAAVKQSANSYRDITELQTTEITSLQLPHLLRYEDRNSMRHSIETRLPFLDYRLVELCISIRAAMKVSDGWTKYALRRAIESALPREIVWRRDKLGFQAPERTWLSAASRRMKTEIGDSMLLRELVDRDRLLADFDQLSNKERWSYYNVAAWERVYSVR